MPEANGVCGFVGWSVRPVIEAVFPRQRSLRNLVSKISLSLLEEELDGRAWTKRAERPGAEEALRAEDTDAGSEVRRLCRKPDRLKFCANLDGIDVVRVGHRFS